MTCVCGHESHDHNWEGHPFLKIHTNCRLCVCKKFEHRKTLVEKFGLDKNKTAVFLLVMAFYGIAFIGGMLIQSWIDTGDKRNLEFLEAKYGYEGAELLNEISFCYFAYDKSHGTDNRCPFWINDENPRIIQ